MRDGCLLKRVRDEAPRTETERERIRPTEFIYSSSMIQSTFIHFGCAKLHYAPLESGFGRTNPYSDQVFTSLTGYKLTTFGFSLLNWGIFYKFLQND